MGWREALPVGGGVVEPVAAFGYDESMKPRVYLETTIPSYLTAWPSRDLVRAAHQQITREWCGIARPLPTPPCGTRSSRSAARAATSRPPFALRKNYLPRKGWNVDDVVLEVRRIREAYAKQFGYDLQAIHRDLKEQEKASGRRIVSFPPRRPRRAPPTAAGAGGLRRPHDDD